MEVDRVIEAALPIYKEIVARYSKSKEAKLSRQKIYNEDVRIEQFKREQLAPQEKLQREEAERQARMQREEQARLERQRQEQEFFEENQRRVNLFTKHAGRKMMASAGGGQDLRTVLKGWSYDMDNDLFEIKIEIYWSGAIFRDNDYNVDGVLTVSRDGQRSSFARTYANSRFKNLEADLTWAAGGLALGALASSGQ